MAIRSIVTVGNDILREQCKPVTVFDDKLSVLIDDMIDTMFKANGVGLAAPQVGILKQVVVICPDGKTIYELVNPVIVAASGKQVGQEGCLSVPNRYGTVQRPKHLTVKYQDRFGEEKTIKTHGFLSVIFCHEVDHLSGILYIDKLVEED